MIRVVDPSETEARFAFDQELASLAAQRTDLSSLQSRAKDILGLVTLVGGFVSVFGKETVNSILAEVTAAGTVSIVVFTALPTITFVCCLAILVPRSYWAFNASGNELRRDMLDRPSNVAYATNRSFYLAWTKRISEYHSANQIHLRTRKRALWIGIAALVADVGFIAWLLLF